MFDRRREVGDDGGGSIGGRLSAVLSGEKENDGVVGDC